MSMTEELTPAAEDILDIASPEEWLDAPAPSPLSAGKYRLRLQKFERDTDRATGAKRKSFTANFVVAEGEMEGRPANFISISTNVYPRSSGGKTVNVVELGDLIRAFDVSHNWGNSIEAGDRYLQEKIAEGATCTLYLDWEAFDSKYWKDQNGSSLDKDAKATLAKSCRIRGMRKFEKDGTLLNPASGNLLKARLFMREAIASNKQ